MEVILQGQVKVFPVISSKKDKIIKEEYLSSSRHWSVDDPQIKKISAGMTTPKQVYDYVVNTLSYDYSQIDKAQRKGAIGALNFPQASLCTEFTDLFISLARSIGIPAREVEGFAYTNNPKIKPTNENTDILHAWPQYFDSTKNKWVSVDPTWEKTTNGIDYFHELDLNHIAFVFHGKNSEYPSPPGSYKNQRDTKTIDINFAKSEMEDSYTPPTIEIPKISFNQSPSIIITNTNPNLLTKAMISNPRNNMSFEVVDMPPYSQKIIKIPSISFFESLHPKYQKLNFEVETPSGQKANYSTIYPPHFLNLAICLLSLIFLLSIGGIIITSKKR